MPRIDTTMGGFVAMIWDGELWLPKMQHRYVWPTTLVIPALPGPSAS
jgi:hypothetical protein